MAAANVERALHAAGSTDVLCRKLVTLILDVCRVVAVSGLHLRESLRMHDCQEGLCPV